MIVGFEGGIERVRVVKSGIEGQIHDRRVGGQQRFGNALAAQHVQILGKAVSDGALEQVREPASAVTKVGGDLIDSQTLSEILVQIIQNSANDVGLIRGTDGIQWNAVGQIAKKGIAYALLQDRIFGIVRKHVHKKAEGASFVIFDQVGSETVGCDKLLDGWNNGQRNDGDDGVAVFGRIGVHGIAAGNQQFACADDDGLTIDGRVKMSLQNVNKLDACVKMGKAADDTVIPCQWKQHAVALGFVIALQSVFSFSA